MVTSIHHLVGDEDDAHIPADYAASLAKLGQMRPTITAGQSRRNLEEGSPLDFACDNFNAFFCTNAVCVAADERIALINDRDTPLGIYRAMGKLEEWACFGLSNKDGQSNAIFVCIGFDADGDDVRRGFIYTNNSMRPSTIIDHIRAVITSD